MKRFLVELGLNVQKEYVIRCDSQSAIDLSKNATFHSITNHIDVRYHWIGYVLENGLMKINKIHTNRNLSDMMMKEVPKEKHELYIALVGISSI